MQFFNISKRVRWYPKLCISSIDQSVHQARKSGKQPDIWHFEKQGQIWPDFDYFGLKWPDFDYFGLKWSDDTILDNIFFCPSTVVRRSLFGHIFRMVVAFLDNYWQFFSSSEFRRNLQPDMLGGQPDNKPFLVVARSS